MPSASAMRSIISWQTLGEQTMRQSCGQVRSLTSLLFTLFPIYRYRAAQGLISQFRSIRNLQPSSPSQRPQGAFFLRSPGSHSGDPHRFIKSSLELYYFANITEPAHMKGKQERLRLRFGTGWLDNLRKPREITLFLRLSLRGDGLSSESWFCSLLKWIQRESVLQLESFLQPTRFLISLRLDTPITASSCSTFAWWCFCRILR